MANRYSVETIFKAVDKMTGPVSRMQRRVRDFTDSATRGTKKVADVMGKISAVGVAAYTAISGAVTLAAGSIALFVTETNEANLEMLNMAKAMGVTYDTVKAMDSFLAGSTMNWENFTDQIEEMRNKFGEMKGAGEMKSLSEALEVANIKWKDLKNLSPEKQYIKIMDTLVKMKDAQKAAFVADEIFGGEGNKIIGLLRARKKTMSEVIAEFQKYNFYTKEGQKATEDYAEALKPLKQSLQTGKSQMAAMIGGALVPYIQKMTEWIGANKELIQTKIAEYAQKIADGMAWLATNMSEIIMWAQRFAIAIGVFIALTTILRTFILVMTAVNLVMSMNPISLIIIAIVALIAVVGYLINKFFGWEAVLKTVEVAAYALAGGVLALMGPIGWLIGAAILIYKNWNIIGPFFSSLWQGIVNVFNTAAGTIMGVIDRIIGGITKIINLGSSIGGKVSSFLGFGGAEAAGTAVSSPQARTAAQISEKRSTSEVTILDQTGRAKVTKGKMGTGLNLKTSGSF